MPGAQMNPEIDLGPGAMAVFLGPQPAAVVAVRDPEGARIAAAEAHLTQARRDQISHDVPEQILGRHCGGLVSSRPGSPLRSSTAWPGHRRRRYLVLGTVSLVVGLGTAAFTAGGGGDAAPGPRITPPVEMYSVEHAITTGEVPFPAPTAESSSNAPLP